jgi:hypothetical protein
LTFRNSGPAVISASSSGDRAGFLRPAARNGDFGAFALLVRLGALDQQLQPFVGPGDVLDVQPNEFGAAHCSGKAEQEQGAIPGAGNAGNAGTASPAQLADLGRGQRRRPPRRGTVLPADAAQSLADRRMLGVARMPGYAAGAHDGSDPTAQGRHRVALPAAAR